MDLYNCTTAKEVEQYFSAHNIHRPGEKVYQLLTCMTITSRTEDTEISPEEDYKDLLLFFLEGHWRFFV